MTKKTFFALATISVLANAALAQEQSRDERLRAIANASLRTSIIAIADSARMAGMSDESIIDLALRGNLTRASADQILKATRAELGYLRSARAAVGADASGADLRAAATALSAGIESDAIRRIAGKRNDASLYTTLSFVTDLVSNYNVSVQLAEREVSRLTVAGANDLYLANFREGVESAIKRGEIPAAAVTTRVNAAITTDAAGGTTLVNGPGPRATGRPRIPPAE